MENQNPLEMQNPGLNKNLPPHVSARAHCVFCGADLVYSARFCSSCGAQAEHAPEPETPVYDDGVYTRPYEDPVKPAAPSRQRPARPAPEAPRRNHTRLIAAIVAIAVIIAILVFRGM